MKWNSNSNDGYFQESKSASFPGHSIINEVLNGLIVTMHDVWDELHLLEKFELSAARWVQLSPSAKEWHWWQVSGCWGAIVAFCLVINELSVDSAFL